MGSISSGMALGLPGDLSLNGGSLMVFIALVLSASSKIVVKIAPENGYLVNPFSEHELVHSSLVAFCVREEVILFCAACGVS